MVSRLKGQDGVTLTELMIVIAIIGGVALLVPPLLTQLSKFYILSRTRIELQEEARAAISVITRNLREAQSSTIKIDQVNGQPYWSRITFTKMQGTVMSYYQSGSNLIQVGGATTTPLSKHLRYLAFTFPHSDDMTILSVSTTLEEAIYEGKTKALHVASEKVEVMNQ
jgi:prepilin-type N-terminal cleavage/methylation domain-containing protein